MARRSVPIEEKIESQKEVVSKAKDRYENELDKLEKLVQKRDELRSKELMEAFARSERSFEEVMRFLSGRYILQAEDVMFTEISKSAVTVH